MQIKREMFGQQESVDISVRGDLEPESHFSRTAMGDY